MLFEEGSLVAWLFQDVNSSKLSARNMKPFAFLALERALMKPEYISLDQNRTITLDFSFCFYQHSIKAAVYDNEICYILIEPFTIHYNFRYDLDPSIRNAANCKIKIIRVAGSSLWLLLFQEVLWEDIQKVLRQCLIFFRLHPRLFLIASSIVHSGISSAS